MKAMIRMAKDAGIDGKFFERLSPETVNKKD